MLIRRADLALDSRGERGIRDVRITQGIIAAIAPSLQPIGDELQIDADGGALLPGLKDHHIHLMALAAALDSLRCGPPEIGNAEQLAAAIGTAGSGEGWLRGVGYHESVAGDIDRHWLDRHLWQRPARIQHRSGRLWILNSRALQALGVSDDDDGKNPCERIDGQLTGRLYDADDWLRQRMQAQRPHLATVSRLLASRGVTGITDTSHRNGPEDFAFFAAAQARGELLQEAVIMGDARLDAATDQAHLRRGATKFHLHDHALPDFEQLCADIRRSHAADRPVAFHCVSRVDLAYALAALGESGSLRGDRIEHASIAPPEAIEAMQALGVIVVTQPNFVAERGDTYVDTVDVQDQPWLYRLQGFIEAGIPLAGGTDAPYGQPDPWLAMAAAVDRRTRAGRIIGAHEALSPEAALALFTSPLLNPGQPAPRPHVGARADCCLLTRPWSAQRNRLADVQVRATLLAGEVIWQS